MSSTDKEFWKEPQEHELVSGWRSQRVSDWRSQRGNVLFMILITIAILAALTYALSEDSTQQSSILSQQTSTDQINRMLTYASALGGALQQMQANGEDPNTLCAALSPPGLSLTSIGFTTEAHNLEIFHPLGGGITYMSASSPDASAVATTYNINKGSSITGVGCTPGASSSAGQCTNCTGHIIFTALISALSYCQQTNNILTGASLTATPPTMSAATFNTLFNTTTAVPVTSGLCASCVNVARQCVTNGSGLYGFYADLFPPQWVNSQ